MKRTIYHRLSNSVIKSSFVFFGLFFSAVALADNSLENRMDRMEKALFNIEEKLNKLFPPVNFSENYNGKSSGSVKEPSNKSSYEQGLWMEFYRIEAKGKAVPASATGLSLGVIKDKDVSPLRYSSFREDPNFDHYFNDYFGVLWSGALEITTSGSHILGMDLIFETKDQIHSKCSSSMRLSGKIIAKTAISAGYEYKKIGTELNTFELKSGLYPIEIWLACKIPADLRFRENRINGVSVEIKHRKPGARAIAAVPSSRFMHKGN